MGMVMSIRCLYSKDYRYDDFKIRTKADAKRFLEEALDDNAVHVYHADNETYYRIEKRNKEIVIYEKFGTQWFAPLVTIADTTNPAYKDTVYDVVYKIRKLINNKWYNKEI